MLTHISALSRQTAILCVVGGASLLLAGCGGSDSSTGPSTVTSAPVTNVILSGNGETLQPKFLVYYPFTTAAAGTIGATVDWTLPSSDVDVFLVRGTNPCTVEQFNSRQCPFLGSSESKTAKPERLSVPDLAAGPYTFYIGNYGDNLESVSLQITLTTTAGTRAASAPSGTGGLKGSLSGLAVPR